jgi:hypothetical protein
VHRSDPQTCCGEDLALFRLVPVRVRGHARAFDSPGFQSHGDEDVERDSAIPSLELDGGEVSGRDGVPFLGDEPLVPAQDRVGRDDGGQLHQLHQLHQRLPADRLAFCCQDTRLVISEKDPAPAIFSMRVRRSFWSLRGTIEKSFERRDASDDGVRDKSEITER